MAVRSGEGLFFAEPFFILKNYALKKWASLKTMFVKI